MAGLEEALAGAKDKYTFMQEKRGYIADLCDMLQVRYYGGITSSGSDTGMGLRITST